MRTSKFLTILKTVNNVPIVTGVFEIIPYGNIYPSGALALTNEHDGIWSRAGAPDGEYSLYYNGVVCPSYQRFWVGDNKISLVADNFNEDGAPKLDYAAGKNKFNKDTAISGMYIPTSTGIITAASNCVISDFIPVSAGEIYVLSGIRDIDFSTNKYINWVGLYDENRDPITPYCITSDEHLPFTIPAGCYYVVIQLSYSEASPNYNLVQLEKGLVVTDFESYALESFASGFRDKINTIEYVYKPGKNLITSQGFNHRYILTTDGSTTTGSSTEQMTSFIEIDPFKVYTFRAKILNIPYGWNFWGAYYDKNFSLITKTSLGLDSYSQKFLVPAPGFENYYTYKLFPPTNAKYLRLVVCFDGTGIDLTTLQLEEGAYPTTFENYYSTRNLISVNNADYHGDIQTSQWDKKKAVFLGDSITYMNVWQPKVCNALGIIYNIQELLTGIGAHKQTALGGSTIAPIITGATGQLAGDSIYKRCDSVVSYCPDLIFLFGGQNDVGQFENAQQTLGTSADAPYTGGEVTYPGSRITTPTFCSSYKGVLLKLITQNPNAKIFVLTPYESGGIARTDGSFGNKENYVEAIIEITKQYSCQLIDLCHESGITIENNSVMTIDGTHPSGAGAERIAQLIISKIAGSVSSYSSRINSDIGSMFSAGQPGAYLGNNNWLIYDNNNNYHEMVEIPAFNWDPTNGFSSTQLHPVFTVNGVRKRIFIGKYQASYLGGHAVTQLDGVVAQTINFDDSSAVCNSLNNGTTINGFHLITNAEWAAICLVSKNIMGATEVAGNNNFGRDQGASTILGLEEPGETGNFASSTSPARWLAGSGGVTTAHDGTSYGIRDMNGNVWEWAKGMRLNNGEINIIPLNDAANPSADVTSSSVLWKGILEDGSLVAPGTTGTLKVNAAGQISKTTTSTSSAEPFESLSCASDVSATSAGVALLKALAIYPFASGLNSDYFWFNSGIEAIPVRGGTWGDGSNAGLRALDLGNGRGYASYYFGFRVAFVY
jgi:lysophospholipase L1-like esterase